MHRSREFATRQRDNTTSSYDRSRSRGRENEVCNRRKYPRTRSPSARRHYRCENSSGGFVQSRQEEYHPERSFTPPLPITLPNTQEGSESIHSLSQALLRGFDNILNKPNTNTGIINHNIISEFNPIHNDVRE